jgi:hypothetical protein
MKKKLRGLGLGVRRGMLLAMLGLSALHAPAAAQGVPAQAAPSPPGSGPFSPNPPASNQPTATQPPASPVCARLESQLAAIGQGTAESFRADQIKRGEDAVAKQQADLDRALAQAHKSGCAGEGFFALFSGLSPQCGPMTSQIQQMRGNLDRAIGDLERLKSGGDDQEGQRRNLVGQLAQNSCGAQYASAAQAAGPRGFFDALFGGGTILNPNDGAPSGTFRTVCVRTCDGYYFPISYSTMANHFADDERTCQRLCPAAEVALYSYRNPGEDMQQAVSTSGQPYTALPTAFHYRKEFTAACSCRRPGQSWADALKNADDSTTLESGDIIVTDQKAKALSQPPQAPAGKPTKAGTGQPDAKAPAAVPAPAATATGADGTKAAVRTVGPPFVSPH